MAMSNRSGPQSRPSPRRKSSRPKLRNQVLFLVGILVLATGAFYTALVVATQIDQIFFPNGNLRAPGPLGRLPGVDNRTEAEIGGGRINLLVMGIDRRPIEGATLTRSDTMFVMTIDPSTKTSRGIAMPRDLWVDIPGKNGTFKERINTALVYGENQNYPGGGPGLARATVEKLLGIKINYYVIIDFSGFKQLIDLMGGIDVDVPTAVNDPFYSETEILNDFYPCVFTAGVHHMNGSDALCYARTRRNSDDLDRITRQQRIIFAALDKASQLKLLSDPSNLVSLWKNYKSTVKTDISDLQIPGFARLAVGMDSDNLAFLSLGPATTPYTTSEGAAVLLPSPEGIKQIVTAMLSDYKVEQEHASVEVQNGTDKQGMGQKVADFLKGQLAAEQTITVANAADTNHGKTEIVDFANKPYTAKKIAALLGVSKDRVRAPTAADTAIRTSATADIVVIVGSDARVDSNAVVSP